MDHWLLTGLAGRGLTVTGTLVDAKTEDILYR
jgi:hypothetical protein